MARYIVSFIFTVFLMAYVSSGVASEKYIYAISKGDKFVLKQDLAIAAGNAHAMLQNGKIMNIKDIDRYAPHCRFEVNTVGEQTIKPATFTVTKVTRHEPEVVRSVYNYAVLFVLTAANNPNIRSLACGSWGSGAFTYLTFPQMQQALGNYFEIPVPK